MDDIQILPICDNLRNILPYNKYNISEIESRTNINNYNKFTHRIYISGCGGLISFVMGVLYEIAIKTNKRELIFGKDNKDLDRIQFTGVSGGAAAVGYFMAHMYGIHDIYWWFIHGRVNELYETRPLGKLINDLGTTFYVECERLGKIELLQRDQLVIIVSDILYMKRIALGIFKDARENGLAHEATCNIPGYTSKTELLPYVDGMVMNSWVRSNKCSRKILSDNDQKGNNIECVPTLVFSLTNEHNQKNVIDMSKWKLGNKDILIEDFLPEGGKKRGDELFKYGRQSLKENWDNIKETIINWKNNIY